MDKEAKGSVSVTLVLGAVPATREKREQNVQSMCSYDRGRPEFRQHTIFLSHRRQRSAIRERNGESPTDCDGRALAPVVAPALLRNSDQCPALMVTVQVVTPVTLVSIVTLVAFIPVMFIVTGSFATRRAATTTLNGWMPGCYIPTPECRLGRLRLTTVYAAAISSCRQREC